MNYAPHPIPELGSSEVGTVSYVSTGRSADVYIHIRRNDRRLVALRREMTEEYERKNFGDNQPTTSEKVAVQDMEGNWCRGLIVLRKDPFFDIELVDFGGVREGVPKSFARPLHDRFLTMERLALKCSLYGLKPVDQWSPEERRIYNRSMSELSRRCETTSSEGGSGVNKGGRKQQLIFYFAQTIRSNAVQVEVCRCDNPNVRVNDEIQDLFETLPMVSRGGGSSGASFVRPPSRQQQQQQYRVPNLSSPLPPAAPFESTTSKSHISSNTFPLQQHQQQSSLHLRQSPNIPTHGSSATHYYINNNDPYNNDNNYNAPRQPQSTVVSEEVPFTSVRSHATARSESAGGALSSYHSVPPLQSHRSDPAAAPPAASLNANTTADGGRGAADTFDVMNEELLSTRMSSLTNQRQQPGFYTGAPPPGFEDMTPPGSSKRGIIPLSAGAAGTTGSSSGPRGPTSLSPGPSTVFGGVSGISADSSRQPGQQSALKKKIHELPERFLLSDQQQIPCNVAYVQDEKRFFLSISRFQNVDINTLQAQMQSIYQSEPSELLLSPNMTKTENLCAAKYSMDGKFYRGRILTGNDNSVNVYFVDFGNEESKSFANRELYQLVPELTGVPAMGVWGTLNGIEITNAPDFPQPLRSYVIDKLYSYMDSDLLVQFRQLNPVTKSEYKADLWTVTAGGAPNESINRIMKVYLDRQFGRLSVSSRASGGGGGDGGSGGDGEGVAGGSAPASITVESAELPPLMIPAGIGDFFDAQISFMHNLTTISVQLKSQEDQIRYLSQLMADMYGDLTLAPPVLRRKLKIGETVAAYYGFDGQWYRGLVKKGPSSFENRHQNHQASAQQYYLVYYLDYGNEEMVPVDQVRELPSGGRLRQFHPFAVRINARFSSQQDEQFVGGKNASPAFVDFISKIMYDQTVSIKLLGKTEHGDGFDGELWLENDDTGGGGDQTISYAQFIAHHQTHSS